MTCLEPDSSLTWDKLFLFPGPALALGQDRQHLLHLIVLKGANLGESLWSLLPTNSVTKEEKENPTQDCHLFLLQPTQPSCRTTLAV